MFAELASYLDEIWVPPSFIVGTQFCVFWGKKQREGVEIYFRLENELEVSASRSTSKDV